MERDLIVVIENHHPFIHFSPVNIETRQFHLQILKFDIFKESNLEPFFAKLSSCADLKSVKAFAFFVADSDFPTFTAGYNFRLKFREFSEKHGIFCFMTTYASTIPYIAINHTKTMVDEGEEVMILSFSDGMLNGSSVRREGKGYRTSRDHFSVNERFTQAWKKKFMGTSKPKKIILVKKDGTSFKDLKEVFKEEKPILFTLNFDTMFLDAMVDKMLHIMGEKINEYEVHFVCQDIFAIKYKKKATIIATPFIILPFESSVIFDVDPTETLTLFGGSPTPRHAQEDIESYELSNFKTKKAKIIFKVDINSFYDFKIEPYDGSEPSESIEKLDVVNGRRVELISFARSTKIVFDKQNFSVVACKDGYGRVMKNLDGFDKTPIYIDFSEKKPVVGKAALEVYGSKSKYVVFDLIKLCSISSADVMNPKWDFSLSKENDTIMVAMETVDGERKSSVDFLLALILKNALQIIKNDTGEKLEQIEVEFDGFVPNEMLRKNFVNAGKLMKVDIVFD